MKERRHCAPSSECKEGKLKPATLKSIVIAYLREKAAGERAYLSFYARQPSLSSAIMKAALAELPSGKRFSHQRRIPRRVLEKARKVLLAEDYSMIKSFSELHELVKSKLRHI